ncbi:HNH endonuclease [Rheinheimera sp.]|uniref:HNH endonuclease n=1 Tax=Rheinheimera sp. TaxID=1869214 RepID=UPI002734149B|nr:HNH endonuclease [Rheinheimera sp.]MDP2714319.1 HNH endonuclease [Rheinheimera sp.]
MVDLQFKKFMAFVRLQSNKKLPTIGGKSTFTVEVVGDGFVFTPNSSGTRRKSSNAKLFFERHRANGSYKTTDYSEKSVNASYYLSLLKSFYADNNKVVEFDSVNSPKAIEGYLIDFQYFERKRNKNLADECKKRDDYKCQACGFKLSVNGKYAIECHHKFPLSESGETTTQLSDLISLCPTCHRLTHLRQPALSITELKRMLKHA